MDVLESVLLRIERESAAAGGGAEDELRGIATALGAELVQHQLPNGSWHDDLFATCETLRTLRHLRASDAYAQASGPALDWLSARVGARGKFGEGCDHGVRHAAGLCHHFLPPLCSPGHPDRDLGGSRLGDGTVLGSDAEVRLCAAANAYRELVAAGRHGTSVKLQRAALNRIAVTAEQSVAPGLDAPAYAALLDALRGAPAAIAGRAPLAAVRAVMARQRGEGSWPHGGDYILDVLSRACAAGFDAAREPLLRAAVHIAWLHATHNVRGDSPRHLLIAWRTLRCVTDEPVH